MIFYKIAEKLKKDGRSLRQIAKDTNISHVTLSRIAKAKTPRDYIICADVLEKLCAFFKCQPGELLIYKKN